MAPPLAERRVHLVRLPPLPILLHNRRRRLHTGRRQRVVVVVVVGDGDGVVAADDTDADAVHHTSAFRTRTYPRRRRRHRAAYVPMQERNPQIDAVMPFETHTGCNIVQNDETSESDDTVAVVVVDGGADSEASTHAEWPFDLYRSYCFRHCRLQRSMPPPLFWAPCTEIQAPSQTAGWDDTSCWVRQQSRQRLKSQLKNRVAETIPIADEYPTPWRWDVAVNH